jgi:hypothetical protein
MVGEHSQTLTSTVSVTSRKCCVPCLSINSPSAGNTTKVLPRDDPRVSFCPLDDLQLRTQIEGCENRRKPNCAPSKMMARRLFSCESSLSAPGLMKGLRTSLMSLTFSSIAFWSSFSFAFGASRLLRIGSKRNELRCRHLFKARSKTVYN